MRKMSEKRKKELRKPITEIFPRPEMYNYKYQHEKMLNALEAGIIFVFVSMGVLYGLILSNRNILMYLIWEGINLLIVVWLWVKIVKKKKEMRKYG